MALSTQEAAYLRQMRERHEQQLSQLNSVVMELQRRPRSITEEIDSIPGRRIVYTLSGDQSFTISNLGLRASPISMLVSQDGPFIMTHYPAIAWYPNLPSNADNLGKWRPAASYPLAAQQGGLSSANADSTMYDMIDISYEIVDGGSQRNFQNSTVSPNLLSTRDHMLKLPVPTLFAPNTTIQVIITYNDIFFGTAATNDTTGGNLHVDIPGYRIVNLGS